jgi:hypothetical protein
MMKLYSLLSLCIALTACTQTTPPPTTAETTAEKSRESAPAITSYSYVSVKPLPGRSFEISITARDKPLFIVNCNYKITWSLNESKATNGVPVWGGVSNACLSQSLIIPAHHTLTFTDGVTKESPALPSNGPYQLQIYGALTDIDLKSPPVNVELMTSQPFYVIP